MNFSPFLWVILKPAIIASDEKGTSWLLNGIAEKTRLLIVGFLKISKPATGNLTIDELWGLKNLPFDKSILVLSANKEKATNIKRQLAPHTWSPLLVLVVTGYSWFQKHSDSIFGRTFLPNGTLKYHGINRNYFQRAAWNRSFSKAVNSNLLFNLLIQIINMATNTISSSGYWYLFQSQLLKSSLPVLRWIFTIDIAFGTMKSFQL